MARNEDRFAGRVALVTGGSRGTGLATARQGLRGNAREASRGHRAPDGVCDDRAGS